MIALVIAALAAACGLIVFINSSKTKYTSLFEYPHEKFELEGENQSDAWRL